MEIRKLQISTQTGLVRLDGVNWECPYIRLACDTRGEPGFEIQHLYGFPCGAAADVGVMPDHPRTHMPNKGLDRFDREAALPCA
jgi:hypothetical protein